MLQCRPQKTGIIVTPVRGLSAGQGGARRAWGWGQIAELLLESSTIFSQFPRLEVAELQ